MSPARATVCTRGRVTSSATAISRSSAARAPVRVVGGKGLLHADVLDELCNEVVALHPGRFRRLRRERGRRQERKGGDRATDRNRQIQSSSHHVVPLEWSVQQGLRTQGDRGTTRSIQPAGAAAQSSAVPATPCTCRDYALPPKPCGAGGRLPISWVWAPGIATPLSRTATSRTCGSCGGWPTIRWRATRAMLRTWSASRTERGRASTSWRGTTWSGSCGRGWRPAARRARWRGASRASAGCTASW